ncbi:unnamed protein product [Cunninghamella blakesleeana]
MVFISVFNLVASATVQEIHPYRTETENCREDEELKTGTACDLTCYEVVVLHGRGLNSEWLANTQCANMEKPKGCYCKNETYRMHDGSCVKWNEYIFMD